MNALAGLNSLRRKFLSDEKPTRSSIFSERVSGGKGEEGNEEREADTPDIIVRAEGSREQVILVGVFHMRR